MRDNALKINPADNVAIAIRAVRKGEPVVINGARVLDAVGDIEASHKIALALIKKGSSVIRYGEPIVRAMTDIAQGEWVHVHNAEPLSGTPVK